MDACLCVRACACVPVRACLCVLAPCACAFVYEIDHLSAEEGARPCADTSKLAYKRKLNADSYECGKACVRLRASA
eukprot:2910528-Pleurochrysis_carterae.AAC.1